MSKIDMIISLVEQGQVDAVKTSLATSPTTHDENDIIKLLETSILFMNLDIMRYLLDTYKPNYESPLFRDKVSLTAVGLGKTEAFKILNEYHPFLLTWDLSHFGDALGHAVLGDDLPLAHFLLEEADCDPNKSHVAYKPSIECAAASEQYEMTELLLKYGAQINGTRSLYMAMESNSADMLSFLTSNANGDINMIQPVGKYEEIELTPGPVLHLAIQMKNKEMVQVLLRRFGADPLVKDESGKTAMDWAQSINDPAIRRALDPTYRSCQIL